MTRWKQPPLASLSPSKARFGKVVILVVDDEADMRIFCAYGIQEAGMEAIAFADPAEATEYLAKGQHVDAVLTDLSMPRMSGLEFSRVIAQTHPDLPIVMMTGFPDRLEEAIGRGILPLVKPFTARQLIAALTDALASSSFRVNGSG